MCENFQSIVAIIPARGGSQRIPRKNIRPFYFDPILVYSIRTAQTSGLFDEIIVTTDDDEIAEVASNYRASVYMRSSRMGHNDVGTQEVTRDVLLKYFRNQRPYAACCIYATAPLMDVQDLIRGRQLLRHPHVAFAMSVGYPPLRDAAQFYFGKTQAFIDRTPLVGPDTRFVEVPQERVCDINTEEDWKLAEQMYLALIRSKRNG